MKRVLITAVSFCFILVSSGFAGVDLPRKSGEIGAEIYSFKYKEPGVMRDKGTMYGLNGAYTLREAIMLRGEARLAWGQVDYQNSGTMQNLNDTNAELRGLGGYGLDIFSSTVITPYTGLGYRYLRDDSSGKITSTGAAGYERESNYIYSPLGIETITKINNECSYGFRLEYDHFWAGLQESHLSDASPAYSDVENDQHKGYGLRGSVNVSVKNEKVDFLVEPFVRYWKIDKSDDSNVSYGGVIIGYGYEPENNTVESGVKFAFKF